MPDTVSSIGELVAAGIVCIPWAIEDKYYEVDGGYVPAKPFTKRGADHELSNQAMTRKDIERMESRTAKLHKLASLSSDEQ